MELQPLASSFELDSRLQVPWLAAQLTRQPTAPEAHPLAQGLCQPLDPRGEPSPLGRRRGAAAPLWGLPRFANPAASDHAGTITTIFVSCFRDNELYRGEHMPEQLRKAFGVKKASSETEGLKSSKAEQGKATAKVKDDDQARLASTDAELES